MLYTKENIPAGPEGIILESLLEGLAEYYSAELSQKIKRGMREKACDKKTVRKDWLEQLVVEVTAQHALQPEKIELIAKRCVEIQNSDNSQNAHLDVLKRQLAETQRSLQNLMNKEKTELESSVLPFVAALLGSDTMVSGGGGGS